MGRRFDPDGAYKEPLPPRRGSFHYEGHFGREYLVELKRNSVTPSAGYGETLSKRLKNYLLTWVIVTRTPSFTLSDFLASVELVFTVAPMCLAFSAAQTDAALEVASFF